MKPNFSIFSDNLDYALGWMVIHSLWQATLIALISGVLMLFLRKKAAKTRYIVANVALACVLAASAVTFCMYFDFSNDEGKLTFTPAVGSGIIDGQNQESTLAQMLSTQPTAPSNPQPTTLISVEGFKDYFNRNLPLILVFWVLGVALFMLRLLGGLSYIYYLKNRMNFPADEYWVDLIQDLSERAGLKKGVELVESAMVRTPMVVGFLKPMILFPMGVINRLSPEEVEAILAHELAHVLRNDYVFNILQSVVEALFYFHPAVWWMSAQISNERESACDDIAINLIKNKMNYARALVAIQEMAYFPMTPALAFAGQRKSQFMMRMQRILNQPNNKTNVMEKLSATCLLLFLMIGLSFGSNLKDNNSNISTQGGPSVFSVLDTIPSNSMYSNLPQSGDYNYEDNTQKVQLKVDEGKVKQLIVNGLDVPEKDIPNFSNLTEKILRKATPPPSTPTTPQPNGSAGSVPSDIFNQEGFQLGENGMKFKNKDTDFKLDENGLFLNGVDENGKPIYLKIDKNGMQLNDDKNYIISSKTNRSPSKNKDPYNTIRFKADDGYSYVVFDLNGEKIWKCYKNDMLLGDLIMKGNKVTINGKVPNSTELLNYGLLFYNNSLNPKTGGFQVITVEKHGECEECPQNATSGYSYHYDNNDCDDCEIKDVEDLKDKVSELKDDLESLEEKEKDSKAKQKQFLLLSELKEFKSNIKSSYSETELKSKIREYQRMKKSYDKLADDCNCPDNSSNSNGNSFSFGTGDTRADAESAQQNAAKLRSEAQARNSNAQRNLQESRNKAEMYRQKAQAERDRRTAVEDRKQAIIDRQTAFEDKKQAEKDRQTALEDDKRARKDSKNEDKREKAKNSIFVNLKNLGYISVNKKCKLIIDKNHIEVDGKTLDNATFKRIYKEFETIYGKKATQLNMYVNGYFTEISKGNVNITGTSTTSLSTDD